jgi:hypothetical protein
MDWQARAGAWLGLSATQTAICCACVASPASHSCIRRGQVANCCCCARVLTSTVVLAGTLHGPRSLLCCQNMSVLTCICPVLACPVLCFPALCCLVLEQWRTGAWRVRCAQVLGLLPSWVPLFLGGCLPACLHAWTSR